jgi:ribosomal protein S18 acetylase RimI-like enzyme
VADDAVTIRPYEEPDRAAVLALAPRLAIGVAPWREAGAVREAVTGWVRGSLDAPVSPAAAVLVAVASDEVVGVVTVSSRRHFAGDVDAYVGELAVAEAAARRGVGGSLMAAAERWARGRGFSRMTLETGAANDVARRFYAALGYVEEDVRLTKALTA